MRMHASAPAAVCCKSIKLAASWTLGAGLVCAEGGVTQEGYMKGGGLASDWNIERLWRASLLDTRATSRPHLLRWMLILQITSSSSGNTRYTFLHATARSSANAEGTMGRDQRQGEAVDRIEQRVERKVK